MADKSRSPLQESAACSQTSSQALEELAWPRKSHDFEIDSAFAWGYSEWNERPSVKSLKTHGALHKAKVSSVFAEARGGMAGLADKIYMRRDRMEHSASVAVLAWVKRYSQYIPEDVLRKILRDDKIEDKKASVIPVLTAILAEHPELKNQLQATIATSLARAKAEGTTAAGSIINQHHGIAVPDLDNTHDAELAKVRKSESYKQDVAPTSDLIIAGIAGDLARSIPGKKYDDASDDKINDAITSTVSTGAGAALYTGMAVHASYASAQLKQIEDAGEKVAFITVGDGRVCSVCAGDEDGNPYAPNNVPPIPEHVGCRCWYAADGALN